MLTLATIERRLARVERAERRKPAHRAILPPPTAEELRAILRMLIEAGAALRDDALGQQLRRLIELAYQNTQEAS